MDATTRFTSRVENYQRYRPSYPREVLRHLEERCGLNPETVVADIGCGTGLLARLFLDYGCEVFGVEPNAAMRSGGEQALGAWPRFHSVEGRAEGTTLPDASIGLVTAAQAFHWFEPAAAGREFRRILKPGGWVALIWNERSAAPGFQSDYENVIHDYAPEITRIDEHAIDVLFEHHDWRLTEFPNHQDLDREGLQGRLASSSYAPLAGAPGYQPLMDALDALFAKYQREGEVRLLYDTKVYLGRAG